MQHKIKVLWTSDERSGRTCLNRIGGMSRVVDRKESVVNSRFLA